MSTAEPSFPLRPGYGTAGQRLKVAANYFPLSAFPSGNIYHYDIDIVPDVPRNIKRQIFACLAEMHRDVIGRIHPVYDGQKSVYSPHRLGIEGDSGRFEVVLPETRRTKGPSERRFKVKVQKVC
ncbi:hypothetical protein BKA69DRAFT_535502 [Paraphysoderma sedebokerense]|nr:hypothetical protein BKA69DRAFT_535502 [Paraphysoderma sedebokerense]